MYLIDTSVISQIVKEDPHPQALAWWFKQEDYLLFLSSVSILELRYGVEGMPQGRRRRSLENWLEKHVLEGFKGRIISVDAEIAELGGRLMADARKSGHQAEQGDVLIAATARVRGFDLATLNRKHFTMLGVKLVAF